MVRYILFSFIPEQNRDIISNDSVYNSRFNYAVSSPCMEEMRGKYGLKGENPIFMAVQNR